MKASAVLLLSAAMASSVMASPSARRAKCGGKPGSGYPIASGSYSSAIITNTASETTTSATGSISETEAPITVTSTDLTTATSTATVTEFADVLATTISTITSTVAPTASTVKAPEGFEGAEPTQQPVTRRGLRASWMWARQNGTVPMPTGGETAPSSIVFPTPSSTQFSSASQTPATTMVITSTVIVTAPTAATVTVTRTTSTTTLFTTAFVTVGPTPPPVYEICQPGNYLQEFNGLFLSSTSSLLETQPYPDVTTAEECCVACQEDSSCNLNYWNQATRECVGLYETNPETCDVQANGGTAFADSETTSTTIIVSNGRCGRWTAAQQGQ